MTHSNHEREFYNGTFFFIGFVVVVGVCVEEHLKFLKLNKHSTILQFLG